MDRRINLYRFLSWQSYSRCSHLLNAYHFSNYICFFNSGNYRIYTTKKKKECMNKDIISVSKYLDKLNTILYGEREKIIGEVTSVQEYPGRTYLYFCIKDTKDQSTIK